MSNLVPGARIVNAKGEVVATVSEVSDDGIVSLSRINGGDVICSEKGLRESLEIWMLTVEPPEAQPEMVEVPMALVEALEEWRKSPYTVWTVRQLLEAIKSSEASC